MYEFHFTFSFKFLFFYRCLHHLKHLPLGASVKLPCPTVLKGQHLRIQLNGRVQLTLCEVKVFTLDHGIFFVEL